MDRDVFDSSHSCEICKQIIKSGLKLKCGHITCYGCLIDIDYNNYVCLNIKGTDQLNKLNSDFESLPVNDQVSKQLRTCPICCDEVEDLKKLPKCSHEMCSTCYKQQTKIKPQCPFCLVFYGIPIGTQPKNGTMTSKIIDYSLSGNKFRNLENKILNFKKRI